MQPVQNTVTDEQFQSELLKRFFHSKSYFYRCIKKELSTLTTKSNDLSAGKESDLFDRLVEKIVISEDKEAVLDVLENIDGFRPFVEGLGDGIGYLRDNDLDGNQMKAEIENLARSLIKIAIKALFEDKTKVKVEALLEDRIIPGFETDEPQADEGFDDFEFASADEVESEYDEADADKTIENELDFMGALEGDADEQPTTETDQFDEIPLDLIENLNSNTLEGELEAPVEEPEKLQPEPEPELPQPSLETDDHAEDFLLILEGGGEASKSRSTEPEPVEPDASVELPASETVEPPVTMAAETPVTEVAESQAKGHEQHAIPDEPLTLVDGVAGEINAELQKLQGLIYKLEEDLSRGKHWLACAAVFDNVAAKSMVCGFEGFEVVSLRAKAFITRVTRNLNSVDYSAVKAISETRSALVTLLAGDIDHVDPKTVSSITSNLESPRKRSSKRAPTSTRPSQPRVAPEQDVPNQGDRLAEVERDSKDTPTEIPVKKAEPRAQPAPAPRVVNVEEPEAPAQPTDFDISKFKLPGEDDQEIVDLLNEISENEPQPDRADESPLEAFSEPESESETELVFPQETESQPQSEQPRPVQDVQQPEPFQQPQSTEQTHGAQQSVAPDDRLRVFKEQSEFYVSIVQDSLEKLQSRPDDTIALEDLELASHSLNELSLKLNLDAVSPIPKAVEGVLKSVVSQNTAVSQDQLKTIAAAYRYFMQIDSVEKALSPKAKELAARVEGLGGQTVQQDRSGHDATDMESFQIV